MAITTSHIAVSYPLLVELYEELRELAELHAEPRLDLLAVKVAEQINHTFPLTIELD